MTFYVQGLNSHEIMPLIQLFNKRIVEKPHKVSADYHHDNHQQTTTPQDKHTEIALQSYHAIEHIQQATTKLLANQVMSKPVITLNAESTTDEAIHLMKTHHFRHIPIVNDLGVVQGIISDRDILRYLSGISKNFKPHNTNTKIDNKIKNSMTDKVITASPDTDVRYIARLFVEQRIGVMPIVFDGRLSGIISRGDLLASIMRHFILELWS